MTRNISLLTKEHKEAQVNGTKSHINRLEIQKVLWLDGTKLELFGRNGRGYNW